MKEKEERKILTSRWLILAIALVMVLPSIAVMANTGNTGSPGTANTGIANYVIIEVRNPQMKSLLERTGIDIVEDYGSFVMAKITPTQKAELGPSFITRGIPGRTMLIFNHYAFDVTKGEPNFPANLKIDRYSTGTGYYFVKFYGPVKQEWKNELEQMGAHIYSPLYGNTFLVKMNDDTVQQVKSMPQVMYVGIYQPAYKISPEVSRMSGPNCHIRILTFPEYRNAVAAHIGKMLAYNGLGHLKLNYDSGVPMASKISGGRVGYIEAVVDSSMFDDIARLPGVQYIEKFEHPKVMNDVAHTLMQSDNTNTNGEGAPDSLTVNQTSWKTPIWRHGLFGQGMVVGESDTGIYVHHDLFRDSNHPYTNDNIPLNVTLDTRKILRYMVFASTGYDHQPDSSPDHGSHVAGTIAGYDNPIGGTSAYDGGAPGAKISFSDIQKTGNSYLNPPNDYSETWDPARNDGAKSYSQSWGSPWSDEYSGGMFQIDSYLYDHPGFMMEWAAGNAGSNLKTIGNEAEAKDALVIAASGSSSLFGSTEDGTDITSFSSRGPTFDNRLKPDIAAPGAAIDSTDSSGDSKYTQMDGTSMATPNSNWAVTLIAQYYRDGFYPTGKNISANSFDASGALLKATIINGAVEMTGSGAEGNAYNGDGGYPSVDQGWGFVNLNNSLYFNDGDARTMRVIDSKDGLTTGQSVEYKYKVIDTTDPLTATIAWSDYPGTVGSNASALVNDYDLTLIAPNGTAYKGNVFTGKNPGYSTTGGSYDHLNPVENIKLISGHGLVTGTWTVRITAYNIPMAKQPFGFVISGNLDLSYGVVSLDKSTYSEKQVPQIRVEDAGAGNSVTVNVSSAKTGDYDLVNCAKTGDGVYEGNITLTLTETSPNDGKLSVKDADTITASYDDVDHVSNATATIDAAGPLITDVNLDYSTIFSAEISWKTSEQANGKIYYGTDPSNLNLTSGPTGVYITNPSVVLKNLQADTLYYYDVESSDIYGHKTKDTNGGSHYAFTTPKKGDILVVVSGKTGYNWEQLVSEYKDALTDTGWAPNFWYSWDTGTPPLTTLQEYKAVLWQVGIEHYPSFDASERAVVKDYNDNGSRLWVNSQDVAWDFGDSKNSGDYSTETHNWLVSQMKEDWKKDPTDITKIDGISGDPISDAYTGGIAYDEYRSGGAGDEVSSQDSGGTTTYVWTDTSDNCAVKWVSSANNGTAGTGVWGGTPSKVQVNNLEWSALVNRSQVHSAIRSDVINKTIVWLIGHDHPDVNLTYPTGGETLTADTVNVTWDAKTYGGTSIANTSLYYSDNGGDAWYLVSDKIGSKKYYNWDLSGVQNGNNYRVKVIVTDDGSPAALSGSNMSGVFTIDREGGDNVGPVTVAGTVTAEPTPAVYKETIWFNATIDDSNKGNSNILEAEYFIDSTGADGAGTSMNAADGAFNSPKENVTWSGTCNIPVGTHTLYVHGKDDSGNWGSFESVNFTVNPGPIHITKGWNLISIPWQNTTTNITNALSDISWDRAMVYINGIWYTYNTARADKYNLGFPDIDNTVGIWVNATADGTISGSKANIGNTSIILHKGWNLVGYPSITERAVSDALGGLSYSYVQTYDTDSQSIITLSASDVFMPNIGYWIYANKTETWTVSWE